LCSSSDALAKRHDADTQNKFIVEDALVLDVVVGGGVGDYGSTDFNGL